MIGTTVAVTHTIGVLALGIAVTASSAVSPDGVTNRSDNDEEPSGKQ